MLGWNPVILVLPDFCQYRCNGGMISVESITKLRGYNHYERHKYSNVFLHPILNHQKCGQRNQQPSDYNANANWCGNQWLSCLHWFQLGFSCLSFPHELAALTLLAIAVHCSNLITIILSGLLYVSPLSNLSNILAARGKAINELLSMV